MLGCCLQYSVVTSTTRGALQDAIISSLLWLVYVFELAASAAAWYWDVHGDGTGMIPGSGHVS
jgi:hypothetical protein